MSILPDLIFIYFFPYEVESAWFALAPGMFNILALVPQGYYRHVLRKKKFFFEDKRRVLQPDTL